MHKNAARQLVELYVDGWRNNDLEKILRPLAENCLVIESHGPTYRGKDQVKKWVEKWIGEGSKVTKWDITSFYLSGETVFFEWSFACIVNKRKGALDGITIAVVKNETLASIHEYRMTKPAFDWKG